MIAVALSTQLSELYVTSIPDSTKHEHFAIRDEEIANEPVDCILAFATHT